MLRYFVPVDGLSEEPYSGILGYPRAAKRQIASRIRELKRLGISGVSFEGGTRVGRVSILGKGYVGLVVLAETAPGDAVALKIRRLDSQRDGLQEEARLLREANRAGVGPSLHSGSRDFLVMEFLDGERIGRWVQNLSGRGVVAALKLTARQVLEDCFRLDQAGLDHGELSSLLKHVIVAGTRATMIDFESASMHRRVSNVTSATQGIFIGSAISKRARRLYRVPPQEEIIAGLRRYKQQPTRKSFDALLSILKL